MSDCVSIAAHGACGPAEAQPPCQANLDAFLLIPYNKNQLHAHCFSCLFYSACGIHLNFDHKWPAVVSNVGQGGGKEKQREKNLI